MVTQSNLKFIFENITEGSVLAFYRKEWYYQLIPFFTRETKNELVPQHCGIVYEVKREEDSVSFMFSEQTFTGGKYRPIVIDKNKNNNYYIFDKYFKQQNLITLHKILMSQEQIARGIADAKQQVGKKYGYNNLIFGIEFIEKILPKRFFKWLDKKERKRVCSTHIAYNLKKAGFMLPKGDFLSPLEITKLNIYS
jgi:hypothetical protein